MKQQNQTYKALRVCELPDAETHFKLFIEKDGEIVPYTKGRHRWSTMEKVNLLQHSQFVLFFDPAEEAKVQSHIKASKSQILDSEDFSLTIADGISEFLKTRYQFAMTDDQATIFKGVATALSRYLYQQPKIRDLLEKLAIHDPYTFYHSFRTAAYAVALNSRDIAWDIALGAILHDIGNLFISPAILNRRGALKEAEWKLVRKHPEEGHALLQNLDLSHVVLDLVIHHHERPDGEGYPHRYKGRHLSREVKLLAFAEVFAALTEPRPYQPAHSMAEALEIMQGGLASFLDPTLFPRLKELLGLEAAFVQKAI